jgi:hypothetical protein
MKKINLTRTQVLFEPEQLQALMRIAEEEGKSVSALLRELVNLALETRRQKALAQAAERLHDVYYSAIDGDDFHLKG